MESLSPGKSAVIDSGTLGYPVASLAEVPAGDYYVQAVLHLYETFSRKDGHVVKLPMDRGEGQHWNLAPGNLYSEPRKVSFGPSQGIVHVPLTKIIAPFAEPPDTKYVKHLRIQSKLLSEFWGRPMYLGATVLLPEGFDEHPQARYPVVYYQGHFARDFAAGLPFCTQPPTPDLKDDARLAAEYGYKFYQDWTAGRMPRMLIVTVQHANPYYDDSYAANSANIGPYGDAIVKELYPLVEQKFRAIAQPWARVLWGGSTGGWEAMAQQMFYPDFYNGAWCNCPDPIDFRSYLLVNLYEDKNAFFLQGDWKRVARPAMREPSGKMLATMGDMNRYELVLGTHGRSGDFFDAWQAVYGPVGADGYPQPIFDKRIGTIDPAIAQYWRDHFDLSHILERDWKTLGPKLVGKLRIRVGDADTFYLENAVRLVEAFLESTKLPGHGPYYGGYVEYGPGQPHCYSGDPSQPVRISRFTTNQRFMPEMQEWMLKTAPPGADVTSWRY